MGIQDQLEKILALLEAAKDDIKDWVEAIKENGVDLDTEDSEDLIAEIESTLHEVGY